MKPLDYSDMTIYNIFIPWMMIVDAIYFEKGTDTFVFSLFMV